MTTRVLSAGLLAGLFAGLAIAILQNFTTTPLIIEAEKFENASSAETARSFQRQHVLQTGGIAGDAKLFLTHGSEKHAEDGASADNEWGPEDGFERIAFTSATTIAISIAFAFLILGGLLISGTPITEQNALAWAAGGFITTGLAPALGLPPELPGMAAADIVTRQTWWLGTAAATATAIWLFLYKPTTVFRAVAIVLLCAPHIIGAPHVGPTAGGLVPAELASHFAASALAVHAALWAATGFAVAKVWPHVAAASNASEPVPQS